MSIGWNECFALKEAPCNFLFLISVTAIGSRSKPELCFFLGRLRWMLLPK